MTASRQVPLNTFQPIDPISMELMWNRLITCMDEVDITLVRTSFSTIIGDTRDFACMLTDQYGRSLAQSTYSSPGFTIELPRAIRAMLKEYPADTLAPGDVLVTNDPWIATGHLPDLSFASPVFRGGHVVAFVGVTAHITDIGGRLDHFDARDIYEEGLRIPPLKLFKKGKPVRDVLSVIKANVRVPEEVIGDVYAIVAALHMGNQRVQDFFKDYDLENLNELADGILTKSKKAMGDAIERLPDGIYQHVHWADGVQQPLRIDATIKIEGRRLTVDLSGSSDEYQSVSNNCVLNTTYSDVAYPFKCSLVPEVPNNEGLYEQIEVVAPEGSVFNTRFPRPVKARSKSAFHLNHAIYGAMAKVMPDKIQAGSGSFWSLTVSGRDDQSQPFSVHMLPNGGKGALYDRDGLATIAFPYNGTVTPVEIYENRAPLIIEKKEFIPDSGGAGQFRGGLGQRISIRCMNRDGLTMIVRADKVKFPPPGVNGGKPGRLGKVMFNGQAVQQDMMRLQQGDVVSVELPGGGGYGEPKERNFNQLKEDIEAGYVTPEAAITDYGRLTRNY